MKITLTIDPRLLLAILFGLLIHLLLLGLRWENSSPERQDSASTNRPLKIRRIRTLGVQDGKKDSVFLSRSERESKNIQKVPFRERPSNKIDSLQKILPPPAPLSKAQQPQEKGEREKNQVARNSANTENKKTTLKSIDLKGPKIADFIQARPAGGGGGPSFETQAQNSLPGLSNSNVNVHLEVPEGVTEDELNQYEMMFYSFQRRTALSYISSFYRELEEFSLSNPHLRFPMTDKKETMTARVTFDDQGNIIQIKMIRWTDESKLNDFFKEVLEEIQSLPNPPKALIEKEGKFNIYYSLIVNG